VSDVARSYLVRRAGLRRRAAVRATGDAGERDDGRLRLVPEAVVVGPGVNADRDHGSASCRVQERVGQRTAARVGISMNRCRSTQSSTHSSARAIGIMNQPARSWKNTWAVSPLTCRYIQPVTTIRVMFTSSAIGIALSKMSSLSLTGFFTIMH